MCNALGRSSEVRIVEQADERNECVPLWRFEVLVSLGLKFDALKPPQTLEIRFREPISDESVDARWEDDDVTRIDSRTVHLESDDISDLPL